MARPKPQNRTEAGTFKPGTSGNPGGRPKGYGDYIRERCGHDGKLLTDTLIALVTNDVDFLTQSALETPNTKEVLTAIDMLWERGYGKTPQDYNLNGTIDTTTTVIHKHEK